MSCILCTILEKINNEFLFNFFQKQYLFSPHNHIFIKDMFYPTIFQRRIVINYSNSANMYWLSPICQLLAWKIPRMEESGGLQSMGPQRVWHDWAISLSFLSLPTEQPGKPKNTGVGSLPLLQQIIPTQDLNWGLLHCRQILTSWASGEIPQVLGNLHK